MARFENRVTSFDLEQLRRAYERHLNLFMIGAMNRRENRPWSDADSAPMYPYDNNPILGDFSTLPPSGTPGSLSEPAEE